jgi:hypothetical protein
MLLGLISQDKCLTLQEKACAMAFIFFLLIQWVDDMSSTLIVKKRRKHHIV